jgi:hypothetical protein
MAATLARSAHLLPVLNEEYATMITRDWNVRHSGSGYVTRFKVRRSFLDRLESTRWAAGPSWSAGSRLRIFPR